MGLMREFAPQRRVTELDIPADALQPRDHKPIRARLMAPGQLVEAQEKAAHLTVSNAVLRAEIERLKKQVHDLALDLGTTKEMLRLAQEQLAEIPPDELPKPRRPRTTREIAREVCTLYRVTYEEIIGSSRSKYLCNVRFYFAQRLSRERGLTSPHIGRIIGDRDHSTVLNMLKKTVKPPPPAGEDWR